MTFLPIVERELRVGARRRMTWWMRLLAALLAMVIFIALQSILELSPGMGGQAGKIEFAVLKWMGFICACAAGLFLTADALSEEKREGTLGLMFLTDLRGHDVVLGKLMSHSLTAFYALLAAFPIMGTTLLTGGVTGGEFWLTLVAISNTLFLSIAAGLAVSSMSRDAMRSMSMTLLALVVLLGGLPLADMALAGWDETKFVARLSMGSPAHMFVLDMSSPVARKAIWLHLGIQHATAWGCLTLASLATPRVWQEKARGEKESRRGQQWRFGGPKLRLRLRRKLLERDAILWLASRDRWMPRAMLGAALMSVATLAWSLLDWNPVSSRVASSVQAILAWLMILWTAVQASRFFLESVQSGALELLLVTPVTPAQMVRNQWLALRRLLLLPVVVVGMVLLGQGIFNVASMGTRIGAGSGMGSQFYTIQVIQIGFSTVTWFTRLAAIAWFGMWMGMTTKKLPLAVLKTFAFSVALPSLALMLIYGLMFSFVMFSLTGRASGAKPALPFWLPTTVYGLLNAGKDLFFIVLSRRVLSTRFRELASRSGQPAAVRIPSARPLPTTSPPVVAG